LDENASKRVWDKKAEQLTSLSQNVVMVFWIMDLVAAHFVDGLTRVPLIAFGAWFFLLSVAIGIMRDLRRLPKMPSPFIRRLLWLIAMLQGLVLCVACAKLAFPVSAFYGLVGYTVFLIAVFTGRLL